MRKFRLFGAGVLLVAVAACSTSTTVMIGEDSQELTLGGVGIAVPGSPEHDGSELQVSIVEPTELEAELLEVHPSAVSLTSDEQLPEIGMEWPIEGVGSHTVFRVDSEGKALEALPVVRDPDKVRVQTASAGTYVLSAVNFSPARTASSGSDTRPVKEDEPEVLRAPRCDEGTHVEGEYLGFTSNEAAVCLTSEEGRNHLEVSWDGADEWVASLDGEILGIGEGVRFDSPASALMENGAPQTRPNRVEFSWGESEDPPVLHITEPSSADTLERLLGILDRLAGSVGGAREWIEQADEPTREQLGSAMWQYETTQDAAPVLAEAVHDTLAGSDGERWAGVVNAWADHLYTEPRVAVVALDETREPLPATVEQVMNSEVPEICGHPAGRLLDGDLEGLDDPADGALRLDAPVFGHLGGELRAVAGYACHQGGAVVSPGGLVIFADGAEVLDVLDFADIAVTRSSPQRIAFDGDELVVEIPRVLAQDDSFAGARWDMVIRVAVEEGAAVVTQEHTLTEEAAAQHFADTAEEGNREKFEAWVGSGLTAELYWEAHSGKPHLFNECKAHHGDGARGPYAICTMWAEHPWDWSHAGDIIFEKIGFGEWEPVEVLHVGLD